jgi:hypothetical protein
MSRLGSVLARLIDERITDMNSLFPKLDAQTCLTLLVESARVFLRGWFLTLKRN